MAGNNGTPIGVPQLELEATIGFEGRIPSGLKVHPDRQHLVYALGCTVVVEDIQSGKQDFLTGHSNDVTCIAISKSGRYIASGQLTYMGFKADVIIWDYETRSLRARLTLHKVKVEALAFSPNDAFLVTLGGQDDGSVVVWNVETGDAICGSPAQVESAGVTHCVAYANNDEYLFVTGGNHTLRVWELDVENRKIRPTDVNMGQVKRIVKCIEVLENDNYFYCGTTTGDIIAINTETRLFQHVGPTKELFSQGISSLAILKTGEVVCGAGDGTVNVCGTLEQKFKRTKKSQKVDGPVTSVALRGQGHQFFVGTGKSHIYKFNLTEFSHELINTCHYSAVNDVAFPFGTSDIFATCCYQDIRVWHLPSSKELLRISVPNMTCNAIEFTKDGRSIVSAWDDGKIRTFFPESGKLMYTIEDAHTKGVTALSMTSDCRHIISGGGEGQVRIWEISEGYTMKGARITTRLVEALKEHKGSVTCIKIRKNDSECVSASTDGTCIIWDLKRFVRNQIMFANTLFKTIAYHPNECQIISSGTDRKIGYWENFDGSLIRELEGSKAGSVNGLDITSDGDCFVTGGNDKLVKVWKYNEGEVTHVGLGHSGDINRVKICPNNRHIVSVSADGAVLRWRFPY